MSASRRVQLLNLVRQNGLWMIEDDYDYDYHYRVSPILPMASEGHGGQIIYIGSFTKLLGSAFRVGYLVAGQQLIEKVTELRSIIDIQGDLMMELALAGLINDGILHGHIKRTKKIYEARMDSAASAISFQLKDIVQFQRPQGGMALWLVFDPRFPLSKIVTRAVEQDLHLMGTRYCQGNQGHYNAMRFGFASLPEPEIEKAVDILGKIVAAMLQ